MGRGRGRARVKSVSLTYEESENAFLVEKRYWWSDPEKVARVDGGFVERFWEAYKNGEGAVHDLNSRRTKFKLQLDVMPIVKGLAWEHRNEDILQELGINGMDKKKSAAKTRASGCGPTIWLAGPPPELEEYMPMGIAGIVTNTVVLSQYAQAYGSVLALTEAYLAMTDKPVVIEIDGHTVEELLAVGKVFTDLSPQIILKIPCTLTGLKAFAILKQEGVETFCTTVFSLTQAAAVAQAGVDHLLPFCDPVREMGGDPTGLIRDCAQMFSGWEERPYIMAALVRSVETAHAAFRDGADELVTMSAVYRDMLNHPLTDHWNKVFLDAWNDMHQGGLLAGVPVEPQHT